MKRLALFICTLLCANVLLAQTRFWVDSLQYEVTSTSPAEVIVYDANSSITTANIPATVSYEGTTYSVTSIGFNAFFDCRSLTSVTIPNSVIFIEDQAFYGCSALTSVTIPNSVTSIGNYAFKNCSSLTSVVLPNNATISSSAFSGADGKITIDSVVYKAGNTLTVGNYTLTNTGFLTFYLEGIAYSHTEARVYDCDQNKSGDLIIPSTINVNGNNLNITSIEVSAFSGCSSLTSVTIPNSVTSIESSTFYGCSALTSVTIPNSVTSIGYNAFQSCSSLTSVTISNSVTSIRDGAFMNCSSLTSVTIPNSVTSIGKSAFYNCSSLTTLNFNAVNCEYSTSYSSERPFKNCPITTINIGDSVERIPAFFAYDLDSLTSITIPNSVTYIGGYAFKNCSSLTSVTIPNASIGNNAFDSCSALTSVSLDMSSIPANLFPQSTALQNLTFGENVTSIASGAFSPYSFLQNVTCLATTPPTIADNTVFPYPNIASLKVPCGTLEDYSAPTSFWNMFFNGRISENGYNVEVSVNDETFGSVAVESDCSTGTLTATANEGYEFVRWNDGNTENPRIVALSSDTTFTAIFAEINESSLIDVEDTELSFYPNPTNSKITFSSTIERIEVIDLTGRWCSYFL